MQKEMAVRLKDNLAREIEANFSRPDRKHNYSSETFRLSEIIPLSESTAALIFDKSSRKKGLVFAYWVNSGYPEPHWKYFFPTDSHIRGMEKLGPILQKVEEFNFPLNFEEKVDKQEQKYVWDESVFQA